MRMSPESPILIGEQFIVKAGDNSKPIVANVIGLADRRGVESVRLQRFAPPRLGYEFKTDRMECPGIYKNRDGSLFYFRVDCLPLQTIAEYFGYIRGNDARLDMNIGDQLLNRHVLRRLDLSDRTRFPEENRENIVIYRQ